MTGTMMTATVEEGAATSRPLTSKSAAADLAPPTPMTPMARTRAADALARPPLPPRAATTETVTAAGVRVDPALLLWGAGAAGAGAGTETGDVVAAVVGPRDLDRVQGRRVVVGGAAVVAGGEKEEQESPSEHRNRNPCWRTSTGVACPVTIWSGGQTSPISRRRWKGAL